MNLTQAEYNRLKQQMEGKSAKQRPQLEPTRDKRKMTLCEICGNVIMASPNKGRSSGYFMNTWQPDEPPRLLPAHQSCYIERMRAIREGEYSI